MFDFCLSHSRTLIGIQGLLELAAIRFQNGDFPARHNRFELFSGGHSSDDTTRSFRGICHCFFRHIQAKHIVTIWPRRAFPYLQQRSLPLLREHLVGLTRSSWRSVYLAWIWQSPDIRRTQLIPYWQPRHWWHFDAAANSNALRPGNWLVLADVDRKWSGGKPMVCDLECDEFHLLRLLGAVWWSHWFVYTVWLKLFKTF